MVLFMIGKRGKKNIQSISLSTEKKHFLFLKYSHACVMVATPLFVSPCEFFARHSHKNGDTKNCSKYESDISALTSIVRTPFMGST